MTSNSETFDLKSLQHCAENLGLSQIKRHIFICADQSIPKCCDQQTSLIAWEYLKKRLKELKLDSPVVGNSISTFPSPAIIFRTKANCLRVCQKGPILVIYPDGVWYHSATPEVIERIIQEHLLNHQIVEEYAFVQHPLTLSEK